MPTGIYKRKPISEETRISMSKCKIGHVVTKETREKISKANALVKRKTGELASNWKGGKPKCIDCGKKLSTYLCKRCDSCIRKFNKGENHYNWKGGWKNKLPDCIDCGKQLSTYNNKKCSEHKGLRGENSPNWKGGNTKLNKLERNKFMETMQKLIFERDDYTCQLCGQKGGYLQVDHIQSWAEYVKLRFSMDNCRTVCRSCHYFITYGKIMPENSQWGLSFVKKDLNE